MTEKHISALSEIDGPGCYIFEHMPGKKVSIDTEIGRDDEVVYVLCIDWKFVLDGWKGAKRWKTLKGVVEALEGHMVRMEYGLTHPEYKGLRGNRGM